MIHKPSIFKRLTAFTLSAALALACFGPVPVASAKTAESWAIYMYICGSDLETEAAQATIDILEMLDVNLPENVTVVMQTGGAAHWWIDELNGELMRRLLYNSKDLYILEGTPYASMGDTDTLEDFLAFCEDNYPADHKALIFWDHGGGSGSGVCFDEVYDYEYLSLAELQDAFESIYGNPEEPVFEFIGFDACLMATADVAAVCKDFAKYLVASQEVEPGCGWSYDGFLGELAAKPDMNGLELAITVCDSYYAACDDWGVADKVTLSVIDLARFGNVQNALDSLSYVGILTALSGDPSEFFAEYGRGAKNAEYYGGGSCEMVDMVSLIKENLALFPESGELLIEAALDCVVYQVTGPYRAGSHGLSAYFPFNQDLYSFDNFFNAPASAGFGYMNELLLMGLLTEESKAYFWEHVSGLTEEEKEEIALLFGDEIVFQDTSVYGLDNAPVYVYDFNGAIVALLDIDPDSAAKLRDVALNMVIIGENWDTVIYLGELADRDYNWETGLFLQGFYGGWGTIDGHFVEMWVESVTDEYVLYNVPIYLNGRQCELAVAYMYESGEYRILAAAPYDEALGVPSKEQLLIEPGDEIISIFIEADFDGNLEYYESELFYATEDTAFYPVTLPDGYYGFLFVMTDYAGEVYLTTSTITFLEGGRLMEYYQ